MLEISVAGSSTVQLGAGVDSAVYDSQKTRYHLRSLGAACLFSTDPRVFYGRIEVDMRLNLSILRVK